MQITVFGATGGTGSLVVQQALREGHHVTVVVRNPDVFALRHERLDSVKGDVFQPYTFEKAIAGKDVVISCLGIQTREPTTVYSEGISNIMNAMQEQNIKRLICLSAGAVIVPPKGSFMTKLVIKNILQRIFKNLYADMLLMEKAVTASDLDWTIIRPPWLRDTGHTGKYRAAINEPLDNPSKISRADLADYIVKHLMDAETFRARVEISY